MISCVVFDFDGTLVLSNDIKREVFYAVADGFPAGRARIEAILRSRAGDRAAIFSQFAHELGVPELATELADLYTHLCHERICRCPQRPGARDILLILRGAGARLYVNSSTPVAPLRQLVDERFGGLFDGVMGGYGCKLTNLHSIAAAERLESNALMMVGDGLDDYDAARSFGCGFVGISGGTLPANAMTPLVEDLRDVLSMFTVGEGRV